MACKFEHNWGMLSNAEFLSSVLSTELELVRAPKKKTDKNYTYYYNHPAAFDIEASSFYIGEEKRAIMYIWQFGMNGFVTYGRTWEEFQAFFNVLKDVLRLSDERRLAIYVHNLKYDWQFFRKRFEWDSVFLLDDRQPAYARCGGIEFRDNLVLAGGVSLAVVGNNLVNYPVQKRVGDLNYNLIRTPETPLSDVELGYCENDVRVIMSYIQEKIDIDGDITKIPLTNTGYVRRACREACFPELEEVSYDYE